VGETGLDYFYDHSPRDKQAEVFRRFLGSAGRRGGLLSATCAMPTRMRSPFCRGGGWRGGRRGALLFGQPGPCAGYLDLGLDLSFSGILTFKTADEIRGVAAYAPLRSILVETDAPFLAPIPFRGKRNEPSFVSRPWSAGRSSRIPLSQAAEATTENGESGSPLPAVGPRRATVAVQTNHFALRP